MSGDAPLGVGVVGAGGFARFLAGAVADLPDVRLVAVADSDPSRAADLATAVGARAVTRWEDLLTDPEVAVVAIMTPPSSHATIARAALEAGRHVWCEKPLATDAAAAADVLAAAERSGRVLVVDHVLRYNPLLRALGRLQGSLLGPLQRFAFENDASDEDLDAGHWFWQEGTSGGIFVEHGVHFFDAAHLLAGTLPEAVQAMSASREDGTVDLVSATTRHPGGLLAGFTHGFSHAHRCERQLMRLDHGTAEVRVDGWIPVRAVLDGWTDDAGADLADELPQRAAELFAVDGYRLGADAAITVEVRRDAGPATAVGRGSTHVVPHHVRAELTLGGPAAKQRVYAESVRAAFVDLVRCVDDRRRAPVRRARGLGRRGRRRRGPPRGRGRHDHRPRPLAVSHRPTREDRMTDQPEARRSARVDKPWGHEEIFAQVEGSYVGKTLHVTGGESLSLQWHHEKDETIAVLSGQVEIDLGPSEDTLRAVTVSPGEAVHIPPGLLHRVRALTDSVLVEASTAAPGWQEDVVRLDDRYGRTRHPSTLTTHSEEST